MMAPRADPGAHASGVVAGGCLAVGLWRNISPKHLFGELYFCPFCWFASLFHHGCCYD